MPTYFAEYQISTVGMQQSLVSGPTGMAAAVTLTPPTAGATLVSMPYANVQGNGGSTELRTITVWVF